MIVGVLIVACLGAFVVVRKTSSSHSPRSSATDKDKELPGSIINSAPLDVSHGYIFSLGTLHVDGDGPADLGEEAKVIIGAIKDDPSLQFEKFFEQLSRNNAKYATSVVSALNGHDNFEWLEVSIYYRPVNSDRYTIVIERVNGSLPHLLQALVVSSGEKAKEAITMRFPELQRVQFTDSMRLICERPWITVEQAKKDDPQSINGSRYFLWFGKGK